MIYSLSFLMPILSLFALFSEDSAVILLPVFGTFVLTPLLDLLPLKIESGKASKTTFNVILYTACSLYLVVFALFLYKLPSMTGTELLMKCSVMGINGVLFGINGAHELGHRNNKFDIFYSKVLLFTTSYMHFYVEHNRGHHRNIATPADPATSRYNETIYAFLVRSMVMSWVSAFKIEKKKNGILKNKTIHYALYQLTFVVVLGLIHKNLLIGFVLHSLLSIILLESVNYIEHYGILRKMVNGRYEKVTPNHSWNSDHFFSRIHLFEVNRHSDHHAIAAKPYHELESLESAPQMPTGYAGMVLLAYLPPLWFKVMNPRLNSPLGTPAY